MTVRLAVRAHHEGVAAVAHELRLHRYHGLEVDFGARRARLHGVEVPLTRREFEVLAYFARNAGTRLHLPRPAVARLTP